ncbi:CNNM domain-containing protein [Sulfurimonas sp. NW9]|uniref:CNNM domain-containing protein n=1 Tax=Sulfurimonas sp. NW9 TaxID=2922728 RepID=UPI003DA80CCF
MELLLIFFLLSVGISFLCSILESVLLSINMSYVAVLEKEKPAVGKLLRHHKEDIHKSIASVLILNTIANTLGAAAVGAQASKIFGNDAVVYVSVVLTFAILFISEIIPKTIGAIYWKQLAPVAAYFIRVFIWITYPIILTTWLLQIKYPKGKRIPTL